MGAVSFSSCGPTQVIAARPADIIYTRPQAPAPGYIWINGDWYWRGGRYEWQEGRWDAARPGRNWHEENWIQPPGDGNGTGVTGDNPEWPIGKILRFTRQPGSI